MQLTVDQTIHSFDNLNGMVMLEELNDGNVLKHEKFKSINLGDFKSNFA